MTRPPNGQVPSTALVTVQTGTFAGHPYTIKLETATAAAVKKAMRAGGITLNAPLGGDRTLTDQANLKNDPGRWGSNLPASSIASPGSSSHGWGDCFDVAKNNAWFAAHCHEYGCVRESPAGENNHYRYLHPTWRRSVVKVILSGVGKVTNLIAPSNNGAVTMFLAVYKTTYFLITESHGATHLDATGYGVYKKALPVAKYTKKASLDRVIADAKARAVK